ncbi:MAG: serine hydrolase domain-containing protein [Pseudoclavibacter sp.]|nr:serine hydrolase domain-containing protein [Pseudoclavibacter sp.]
MPDTPTPSPEGAAPARETRKRRISRILSAITTVAIVLAVAWWTVPRPVHLAAERSGDAALAAELASRLAGHHRVAIALWDEERGPVRFAGFGADERLEFEIGSITKTFTGALLMDMVARGEVRLDTSVEEILGERAAGTAVAEVRLHELASHTSGMPRLAEGTGEQLSGIALSLLRRDPYPAEAHTVVEQALASRLSGRGEFAYSNLGTAFLGQLLAQVADAPYERLVAERLLAPLGMTATSVPVTADRLDPQAPRGTTASGHRAAPWTMQGSAPAGGVRSTAADTAAWVRAMQSGANPGAAGLDLPEPGPVAWVVEPAADGGTIVWHNGRTGGFSSFAGYHRETGRGVVLLSATAADGLERLGLELLGTPSAAA